MCPPYRRGDSEERRYGTLERARIVAERKQKEGHATAASVLVHHGSAQIIPRAAMVDRTRRFMDGYLGRGCIRRRGW